MKEKKKYIIKESELKEIIQEMILMEVYDPGAFTANFKNGQKPDGLRISDFTGNILDLLRNGEVAPANTTAPGREGARQAPATPAEGPSSDDKWYEQILDFLKNRAKGLITYHPNLRPDFPVELPELGVDRAGNGHNADATEQLNVGAACYYLQSNAYPQYIAGKCGHCARAVRKALKAGGLNPPWGMDGLFAKNYIQILPKNGWVEIDASQAGQPGDVFVIDKCVDSKQKAHNEGHIGLCLGNGKWGSDYIHGSWHGLAGEPPPSACYFFRYRNRV